MHIPERFLSSAYQAVRCPEQDQRSCHIDSDAYRAIEQHGQASYPLEACGLLIGRLGEHGWQISQARAVANLNTDRASDRFALDPQGYQQIDQELRHTDDEIIGIYHSHPDCPAWPSPTDLESAWPDFVYLIVSIQQAKADSMQAWSLDENTSSSFAEVSLIQ